ncbi:unnamed protein product [Cutaneotrichosporon oleaginosum]
MEAVRIFQQGERRQFETRFLLESPVLYESVRPFLQTLQQLDSLRVPLQKYLVFGHPDGKNISMPQYMLDNPERVWDLSCLLKDASGVVTCQFTPHNELSIANARETMRPPGTGKTFTGVELLRVLFANKAGPVLLLAFTNHALDHIIRAIHDADVTKDIVRLGSRSKDEVVSHNTTWIASAG